MICTALIWVELAVSVESVKEKLARLFRDLKVLMASRNSVICTAFASVTWAVRGSSVNVLEKVAVTDLSALIVTVQVVEVPLHAPPHSLKLAPDPADAVSVTLVLIAYTSEQSEPQLMPAGLLVTVPLADPAMVVCKVNV